MSNKLMIRYGSDELTCWSWVSLDEDNKPFGDVQTGDLTKLVADADGKKVVLVVAGRSLLITTVDLPDGNLRTISSAIPYAMEEQIADDVDNMHFVQGIRQADGSVPVVAISKYFFTELLQRLVDAGLYPAWVVAEPLLLPWNEHELSISILSNKVIVRDGKLSGYECSIDQLPTLLECSGSIKEYFETIRIWTDSDQGEIRALFDEVEDKLVVDKAITVFDCLTGFGEKQTQINLQQGFNSVTYPQSTSVSWKPALALSLATIMLYFATSGYQYFSLQQRINEVTQQSEKLFRETFPDVRRVVQPLVQAQQKLDQRMASNGQATDDLLNLLLALGEAKQKNKAIEVKNLEYRQNSLVVQLEGKSIAQIERLKLQIESVSGANTNILSTVSKEGRVEARVKIKAGST